MIGLKKIESNAYSKIAGEKRPMDLLSKLLYQSENYKKVMNNRLKNLLNSKVFSHQITIICK